MDVRAFYIHKNKEDIENESHSTINRGITTKAREGDSTSRSRLRNNELYS